MTDLLSLPPTYIIPQSVIDAGGLTSVPLYILPIDGGAAFKIGIFITLTDPTTGTSSEPLLYEFDTGGEGFWAKVEEGFPTPAATAANSVCTSYFSGITYKGVAAPLTVNFFGAYNGNSNGGPATGSANVALIQSISNDKNGPSQFPIFGWFYGDFGVSLQATATGQTTGACANCNTGPSLLTVLSQLAGLPAGVDSGFVVALGNRPDNGKIGVGQLVLGVTPAVRALFPSDVLDITANGSFTGLAKQSIATYGEVLASASLTMTGPKDGQQGPLTVGAVGVVFDTGAPTTMLHQGTPPSDSVLDKTGKTEKTLTAAFDPAKWTTLTVGQPGAGFDLLNFTIGDVQGSTAAGITDQPQSKDANGYVNTGLNAFFGRSVLYDLSQSKVRFNS